MDVLVNWLADAGIQSNSLEQDFASGYLFARLLQAHSLQPDLQAFSNKGKPDAYLNNYMRLQPTLNKLGVKLDTRTAQALINKEPGLAAKVLLSIKQQLDGLSTNLQAASQASKKLQQCTVCTSPSRGLLEAQQHKSQYAALDASNNKFFEDVMRKNSASPNMLMESLHLKQFTDEGSRQAAAAAEAAAAAAAAHAAGRSAFRDGLKTKMAVGRTDKAVKLERDEAVHAAILRHQDDVERQELRVEMALAEIGAHRQQDQRRSAAADAAAGIDAFEMTLKRLGTAGGSGTADTTGPAAGESPMATLGRIRSFAPTAAKLADSKGEYLSVIKARRQEEAAARKEREGRRRRMLVEQQAARSAAEGRVEADCLLEVLVRRSAEEQKLAQHLWQLQQEKAAMEAGRKLREEQYAALKDKEWEDTLRREAALHRSLHSQHTSAVQQELATWREQQDAAALAAEAEKAGLARETAWQLVQLAERVVEFRAATGGQAVPLADWRAWVSLFSAGDPALGSPIIASDTAALQEAPSAQAVLNTAELQDYLACQGAWALDTATAHAASAASTGAAGGSASSQPTPAVVAPAAMTVAAHANKSLGKVVAELAQLAQKLRPKLAAAQQQQQQQPQESQSVEEGASSGSAEGLEAPESRAAVVTAAEAAAGSGAAPGADVIHSMPLKLAVVGSPFSGKSTVAHTLAQAFGLRLLSPQQLVTEAIAAARAWEQQSQADPAVPTATAASGTEQAVAAAPSPLVQLGLQADADILAGHAVSDELTVQMLLLAMQQAKTFVPADKLQEPTTETPTKGTKAATLKAATKSEGGAAGARHGTSWGGAAPAATSPTLGVAAALAAGLGSAGSGPALPASLAAGIAGRGFVIDGFPATNAQAQLLEKALTGLDLAAEQELLCGASVISPAPAAKLPQLQRPLLSGLDAVLLLDCADEAQALQRVLGRKLDPVTGQLYHLDFDPPPANNPGLVERLVQPPGQEEEAGRVPERLASWASRSTQLTAWLARFSSLRRPLDGAMPLADVLVAAGDVASGILTAKAAAQAARAASEAAEQARASAEKAQELSKLSQAHAEAAARDLLAAKKAEMQVLPLLTGGKNPDPAAAELLKAQAAAKCAEQLKACHTAASDAATQSEHARTAAETAAAAVLSAQKSVLDAAVSAEAQAQASKAAAEAEAAATAAADAANKAQAAKQLSDGYAQDAAKWAAAVEVSPDASIASAMQPARAVPAAVAPAAAAPPATSRPATGRNSSASTAPGKAATGPVPQPAAAAPPAPPSSSAASSIVSSAPDSVSLKSAGALPAPLAVSLHEEWCVLERAYVDGMGRGFAGLREAHSLAVNQVAANRSWFTALLQQPDNRQALLSEFVARFNSVELDTRKADATKGELLLRCEELRDALWALCDAKHDAVEAARLKLAADGSAAEQVSLMGARLTSLVQVEVDRFTSTAQFLWSYCHNAHGVYHPAAADKAVPHINVLAGADAGAPGSKTEQAKVASMGTAGPHFAALQQRLPQLAAALKTALMAASAAETAALGLVNDAQQKSAAAAAHATTTANTAAAAAAAAAGQPAAGAAGHRQAASGSAKSSAGAAAPVASPANSKASAAAAAAAASSKLAASSEEAASAAAAAAAVAATMPDQAELAAVHSELQVALGLEVALLQQRLSALAHRASVLTEEVVQLHGAVNSQLAEWSHARYVAECGAVAALERVVRAAAASGKPLAQDLKLEDEFLVVEVTQQADTPRTDAPAQRPSSPVLPPGVLSLDQLAAAAAAMQSAEHPAGFLAMQAAVDLMLSMASQGVLPAPWRDIDATHMASALSAFDPTYSGYLDWRALLLALAAATFRPLHTATAAQLAAQALQLAAADGDKDGKLTQQEFEWLRWWFEPRAELQEAAAAAPEQHADVLQEVDRCHKVTNLLWNIFKEPAAAGDTTSPAAQQAVNNPAPPAVRPEGAQQAPNTASAAADPASAPPVTAAAAMTADGDAVYVVPAETLLLYLCADRDLYAGISKAMSVVAQTAGAGAKVDAQGVLRMCYPLIQPAQAALVCRAPLSAQQVAAAVTAATAAGTASQPAPVSVPAAASTTGGKGGGGSGAAGSRKPSCPGGPPPAAADAASEAVPPSLTPSQLMYSAPCERIVTLLLSKYQWQDVYVNALL